MLRYLPAIGMLAWLGLLAGCDKKFSLIVTNSCDRDIEISLAGPGDIQPESVLVVQANNQVRFNVRINKKILPAIYQVKYEDRSENIRVTSKTEKVIFKDIAPDGEMTAVPKEAVIHKRKLKESQDIPIYQGPIQK